MSNHSSRTVLRVVLWTVQVLLASAFGMAGLMKLGTPPDALVASGMAWAGRVPEALVRFIGLSELLGAIGLILPSALRVLPRLTPLAAAGLVTIMALAAAEHTMAAEYSAIGVNAVLAGLAAFVIWGRTRGAPIQDRRVVALQPHHG